MTAAGQLARFVVDRSWDDLSERARQDLKIRVLDALGALGAPPVAAVRAQVDELGGHPLSTLIGGGGTGPDRAALYNGALVRSKPEVGIQFRAGGASTIEALEAEGTRDIGQAIELAKRHRDAGAQMIMIESEGITEQVREWRTDVVARVVSELRLENVMFEAADPDVFTWYVKNYGTDVNLFVDHKPDRPARVPARWHLGNRRHLGTRPDLFAVDRRRGTIVDMIGMRTGDLARRVTQRRRKLGLNREPGGRRRAVIRVEPTSTSDRSIRQQESAASAPGV